MFADKDPKYFLLVLGVGSIVVFSATGTATELPGSCVQEHNAFRKQHGAPPLQASPALAKWANERATTNAKNGKSDHLPQGQNKNGENLYNHPKPPKETTCAEVVKGWYDEVQKYNFNKPPQNMDQATGHFTQVVWKSTKQVGCASAKSSSGAVYVACEYDPPGNFPGKFGQEVGKKQG